MERGWLERGEVFLKEPRGALSLPLSLPSLPSPSALPPAGPSPQESPSTSPPPPSGRARPSLPPLQPLGPPGEGRPPRPGRPPPLGPRVAAGTGGCGWGIEEGRRRRRTGGGHNTSQAGGRPAAPPGRRRRQWRRRGGSRPSLCALVFSRCRGPCAEPFRLAPLRSMGRRGCACACRGRTGPGARAQGRGVRASLARGRN